MKVKCIHKARKNKCNESYYTGTFKKYKRIQKNETRMRNEMNK